MRHRIWMVGPVAMAVTLGACTDATGPADSEAVFAQGAVQPTEAAARGAVQPTAPAPSPTLVDVAVQVNAETGEFSTLIAAVLEAGLADELSARGQRTVFAPTDAAFAALGLDASNVGTLGVETLTAILLYHVAPGRRDAAEVLESDRIRMAGGGFTTISVEDGAAYINDAQIVQVDVMAGNGIIHVIDGVLLP